ncbi:MAG TPA: ester cyclase [Ktedonobacterales bacterium]
MAGEQRSVRDLVEALRTGRLSRRKLIGALTALGVTGAGAAAIAAVARGGAPSAAQQRQHLIQHDQHIAHQTHGNVKPMLHDYANDAVVDDPLFSEPFVGLAAIERRFAAEVASVPDRALTVTNRFFAGEQLIVEWVATGTHANDFLGFGGTGRAYRLTGVTVVTRREGKIVRESHYFDVADLRRQVEGAAL